MRLAGHMLPERHLMRVLLVLPQPALHRSCSGTRFLEWENDPTQSEEFSAES